MQKHRHSNPDVDVDVAVPQAGGAAQTNAEMSGLFAVFSSSRTRRRRQDQATMMTELNQAFPFGRKELNRIPFFARTIVE